MPTLRHSPGSNVTPEPPASSGHYSLGTSGAHIYLALAAVVVFAVIRLAAARFGRSQLAPRWAPTTQLQDVKDSPGPECRKDSAAAYKWDSAVRFPWQARDLWGVGLGFGHEPQQAVRAAGILSPVAGARQCKPAGLLREMEGIDDARKKDHSGSASRGVSSSNPSAAGPEHQQTPPPFQARPGSSDGRRGSRSPHSPPLASSSRSHSGSSDGAGDRNSKGKGPMVGHSGWMAGRPESPLFPLSSEDATAPHFGAGPNLTRPHEGAVPEDRDQSAQRSFTRPPPPPPLTPPTLGNTVFRFEDRRPSFAVSIPPELDTSFIHQPNPDFMGGSTSADIYSSSPLSATATPRRRSYAKSLAVGIPIPTTTSASSSTETMTSGETFSPSSYPPTSPLLPPPPPGQDFPYEYEFVGGPGGPGIMSSVQEIDLHGEIISVMDDAGHGWKRHTRVYGGGVCLACAAAGEQGGFYGDKVPLEDRR